MAIREFKVEVVTDDGTRHICDGIEWKEKLWLVPYWLDDTGTGQTTPARIIRFDSLPYDRFRNGYVVNLPIPKALFHLAAPLQPLAGFEYEELPAVTRPAGQKPH
jgi:hypothetical protein